MPCWFSSRMVRKISFMINGASPSEGSSRMTSAVNQIVDRFYAKEHLSGVATILYGTPKISGRPRPPHATPNSTLGSSAKSWAP